ncbi:Asp23/Gls24 family envelope stress response protein [Lancefieldella sp. Marseille-Q7238]|uniref:Asp23/Gls24 family envelope stress response protein n=1 Tax=Lancefieldella sp. Marseille-Q7238 TaxID=3022127 RepID=UPI0024A7CE7B|nr:Asp23/Gls24 family envelope stress response protein [Lancefieldella sp. Marseille-Q7238]
MAAETIDTKTAGVEITDAANSADVDKTVDAEIVPVEEAALTKPREDSENSVIENSAVESSAVANNETQSDADMGDEDSLTFSDGVIEKIAALSLRDVDDVVGARGNWLNRVQDVLGATDAAKGVSVEVAHENAVRIDISVLIRFGAYAPQVFENVKQAVSQQVNAMTGLEVIGINLRIEDVLTEEEYERMRGSERTEEELEKESQE